MDFDKFMIVGGNFNNKGAEAMMYIAISEIRKRFPNAEIYTLVGNAMNENKNHSNIRTNFLDDSIEIRRFLAKDFSFRDVKPLIKYFLINSLNGKLRELKNQYNQILSETTAIVDISGYGLASNWPVAANMNYINLIRYAKAHGASVYLFPQSFGPFEYEKSGREIEKAIKEFLPYCQVIFAREQEGKTLLENRYGLKNVKLSTDLVLQNKEIDYSLVFKSKQSLIVPNTMAEHNVAILPNCKLLEINSENDIINLFAKAIDSLDSQYHVYLVSHAHEDMALCKKIKLRFTDANRVKIIEREMNCLEYSEFVSQMDFIVASRYHSIVHAYKSDVPCIVLGWATKYVELLTLFRQETYMLDARRAIEDEDIASAINTMEKNYIAESKMILNIRRDIQKASCFDALMNE